jgi:predicted outer membrane protein
VWSSPAAAPTLRRTSAANNGEVEMAKVALKTSESSQVKGFATMMVNEHTEAEAQGKEIAEGAKLVPAESDAAAARSTTSSSQTCKHADPKAQIGDVPQHVVKHLSRAQEIPSGPERQLSTPMKK